MHRYFLFTLIFVAASSVASTYNQADLTALATEGSYQEFLDHALDIRPSERGEEWRKMVTKMALAFAKATLNENPIPRKNFRKTEELYHWPSLRHDDVFRARRTEIGVRYLRQCTQTDPPCWSDLTAFWKEDSSDPDMAVSLAEMVKDRKDSPYSLWTLLERPLRTPFSEFYCKKPFVMDALWEKLGLDYLKLNVEGNFLTQIEETIHADCLPTLASEAKARVYGPKSDNDRELAFEILRVTGKADQKLQDFFYTLYLLEHPSQGEVMNLAWNAMSAMGHSADRREAVMEEMKKLDPLPDAIMGSLDISKRRAVLRHFKTHFPEYFDFYASQCLAYYGGEKKFSKGNPTMKCQDLMNSDLASELLPESRITQFKNVKKI
ncbi:MAG: hypothetical protein ACJ76H_01470 [Bacteriovoracaceae bacterium]